MKRAFLSLVVLIVAQAIVASISGRKIYGRPVVIDNRPLLAGSVLIDHLEAPNVVVTSTGDSLQVVGVVFEQWAIDSPAKDLHEFFNDPDPIRICSDPKQPSGVAFEWKFRYWCGNTFFPRFFPKPLPRYEVADLGRGMVAGMLARDPSREQALNSGSGKSKEEAEAVSPNRSLPASQKSTSTVRGSED
ncbi:MAG: hypothetical protein V4675_18730 [Verrucomicrobiota bacterium]